MTVDRVDPNRARGKAHRPSPALIVSLLITGSDRYFFLASIVAETT
jgi:hypothetical protein